MRIARKVFRVVDDVSFGWLLTSFLIMVAVFGLLYWYLSDIGHGVGQNNEPVTNVSILTGIYFSIVTVSSLGYGDFHPIGFSKILVSVEVLLGLAFIGVMIAKLTSGSLSNLVSRLFVSDTRKQLNKFVSMFNQIETRFREILREISPVYHRVPDLPSGSTENRKQSRERISTTTIPSKFRESTLDLKKSCAELRDYFRRETNESIYFRLAPAGSVIELANVVRETLFYVSQCIMALPLRSDPTIFDDILNKSNREAISEAVDCQKEICLMFVEHSKDDKVKKAFDEVEEICRQVSLSYFQVPDDKPDQVAYGSSEPQSLGSG